MAQTYRRYRRLSVTLIVLPTLILPLFIPNAADAAEDKVTICHLPPGNPQNRQTIVVGSSAVAAHLKHGDSLGACPSGCQLNANLCDDGNQCTTDVCLSDGTCSHKAVTCDDGNICTVDACDPLVGCTYTPVPASNRSPCNDGNACTTPDFCVNGTCSGTPVAGCCTTAADCNDNNPCTEDVCTGNVCYNPPKVCTSSDQCTVAVCDAQGQCATTPRNCDDSNICTDDSCDPNTGCVHTATQNPPEPGREVSCSDGLDNDCDGLIDAADPDCQQQCPCPNCAAASPRNGVCAVDQCNPGFADCDGVFSNGCEINIATDANHCGTCSNVCASSQTCSSGQCINVGQCAPGLPVTHSNGLGQSWTDCVPLNTYNQTQAIEACVASTGSAGSCGEASCGSANLVCSSTSCWAYSGSTQGHVSTSGQLCPTLQDPSWH